MDHRLEKALDFSNYLTTFYKQRELLLEKFKEETVYYYNGGKFTVTHELINYCYLSNKTSQAIVLIDDSNLPIKVDDIQQFYVKILTLYQTACDSYYNSYEELQKERSTESLVVDE